MLQHYVVFQSAPGKEAELDAACAELGARLADSLEGLEALSSGRNTNASGLDRGFTHGCLARFADDEAFQRYWDHPAHRAFMSALDGLCSDRFAIDYRVEDDA